MESDFEILMSRAEGDEPAAGVDLDRREEKSEGMVT